MWKYLEQRALTPKFTGSYKKKECRPTSNALKVLSKSKNSPANSGFTPRLLIVLPEKFEVTTSWFTL